MLFFFFFFLLLEKQCCRRWFMWRKVKAAARALVVALDGVSDAVVLFLSCSRISDKYHIIISSPYVCVLGM